MKIVPIFAQENENKGLFSIQFDGESEDELTKCMDNWFDVEYLDSFFTTHKNDLNSDHYGKNRISISDAISFTREEAYELFERLQNLANNKALKGKAQALSVAFKPLDNGEITPQDLQEKKGKSRVKERWLRIYAIGISPDTFIVTGGAIKLVHKMNERQHLRDELKKLKKVKSYLVKKKIIDQADFNDFEI